MLPKHNFINYLFYLLHLLKNLTKMVLVFLLLTFRFIDHVNALECGIIMKHEEKDINKIITTCLIPTIPVVEEKVVNITQVVNTSIDDEPEDLPIYSSRRGVAKNRYKRDENDENTMALTSTSTTTTTTTTTAKPMNENGVDPKKCVVKCIIEAYELLGTNGSPNHNKVSAYFTRNAPNRVFKDFLQDSVDECFHKILTELGETSDSCVFSARLITCMAEIGKRNCGDWPVGELPFPHNY